jgi:hypothetical protein
MKIQIGQKFLLHHVLIFRFLRKKNNSFLSKNSGKKGPNVHKITHLIHTFKYLTIDFLRENFLFIVGRIIKGKNESTKSAVLFRERGSKNDVSKPGEIFHKNDSLGVNLCEEFKKAFLKRKNASFIAFLHKQA